jgi:CRP-like cAMP-binding protein
MSSQPHQPIEGMIRKLGGLVSFTDADREALARLPYRTQIVGPGTHLVREGNNTTECCLLVSGYACRNKLTSDGGRQIVSFHIPGDLLDLQHLLLPRADHNVQTITSATVAWIPSAELHKLGQMHPAIGEALWRDTLIDASIFREWVLNVGRRDAKTRIAHMLCEFVARHEAAGLGSPDSFEVPMTQEQIGDATGLTAVHVNRMFRALEEDGVITRKGKSITICDWARMRKVADFHPGYLHEAA